ncbi:MAG: TorF family putative porin [Undibacterium sp.]|nr:TorF family putative porin [Undibacterium sp.]
MKNFLFCATLVTSIVGVSFSHVAYAQDAKAPEAKPDNEVSFNLGVISDYRYRGISQSRLQPALQGGLDYTDNVHGFYAGTWMSTIKWTKDAGGGGDLEVDLYAGKRGEITKDVSYDLGVLAYVYPANGLAKVVGFANANTTELYGQIGFGPGYIKYSHSVTNLFGFIDSKSSGYFDLGANVEMNQGYTLNLHFGSQTVKNNGTYSYKDWKIGVTKEWVGVNFSLAMIGTNANEKLYVTPSGKFTGKRSLVVSAVKTF